VAWVYDPHSDEEGCFGWAGERIERLSEIHVKDDKGGEEAGETGKPEPVGGIDDDDENLASSEEHEIGQPVWLKWVLAVTSHLLLLAIGVVVTWIFFPHEVILVIDPFSGTVRQGHVSRDGTMLEVPGMPPIEIRRSDRLSSPAAPQEPQPPLHNDSGKDSGQDPNDPAKQKEQKNPKDQNAPRK